MRVAAVEELCALASEDPRVLLLTGDLGYGVVERFAERFPARFVNVGVAEQNLVGLATGLAEGGYLPYAYSISTFATLRPFEFLRDGPALMRLPVRVLGVGGGFDYGAAGPTHFGLEDLGAMRLLPHTTVLAPADDAQTRAALRATRALPGLVYLRLGKDPRPPVPGLEGRFRLGRVEVVREGRDVLLLATGALAAEASTAARLLEERGVQATVAVVACLAPEPRQDLARLLARHPLAVAVEAHVRRGGLASLAADVVAERGIAVRVLPRGIDAERLGPSGGAPWLLREHGLDAPALAEAAAAALAALRSA